MARLVYKWGVDRPECGWDFYLRLVYGYMIVLLA